MNKRLSSLISAAALSSTVASTPSSLQAAATAPSVVVMTNAPIPYIFTLQPGVDAEGLARELNLQPTCIYRYAINGFVAAVPPDRLATLRHDSRIVAVECNGQIRPANGDTIPLPTTH